MKIYFVRHGQSEANVLREISNRGWRHPLTELGRRQAADLAERMQTQGVVKIYTSPLMRAVQTAQILADRLGIAYEISDSLREYDCGIAEGRADPEAWDLWSWARAQWFEHGLLDAKIEGGESFNEIYGRFVPLVEELSQRYGATDSNLILVGHGGLYTCVLPLVLTNIAHPKSPSAQRASAEWAPVQGFDNTAYVLAEHRPQGLVCLSWCGTPIA